MPNDLILSAGHLGFQWQTIDPFLFCVHHDDHYPTGNDQMGPNAPLTGRNIGQDFAGIDGWRMYHGDVVPGFPRHPHRGFETVTVVRRGYVDHSDSIGATARYGHGDIQWMTAGSGIVHAEMFPLVDKEQDNPCELFQIWINLPARSKMVEPYFKMLWSETVPFETVVTPAGEVRITVMAGTLGTLTAPSPAPNSWAADPSNEVGIWSIQMSPGAIYTLPAASAGVNRTLYLFQGGEVEIGPQTFSPKVGVQVRPDRPVPIVNGSTPSEILVLQGKPIGEPVAHYGPFVMNTRAELQKAFDDYRQTQFGGWPWERDDPVHVRTSGRFAQRPDGTVERPS